MPEVASIFSGAQVGVETTSGTAVSASRLMRYLSWEPSIDIEFNKFRPMGQVVASAITPGKDFTSWSLTGAGSYGELHVPLSSVLNAATVTTVETTGRRWTFTPAGRSEDTIKTYTVETGSSVRAQKATYVFVAGMEFTFNRSEGVALSGSAIGQQIQDNITLTATPTAYGDKPILPTHLDVYVDTTSSSFGVTKLTRDFNAVFRVNDRWGPVWPINSANASFAAHVNQEPTVQMELTVAADSAGMAYLTNARAGDTRYLRLSAVSTENAGAGTAKYDCLIDMAGKISNIAAFDDEEGVKVLTYTFDAVYDTAWSTGKYLEVRVTNQEATV
jgi:hypothetical protein